MPLVDVPIASNYAQEAFLCAGNALKVVFDVILTKSEALEQGIKIDQDTAQEYEAACQHLLRTALVFAQQAYEMYLRAKICEVSPFLLITDLSWTSKAKQSDVRFSDVKSVNAADLPDLALSVVTKEKIKQRTIIFFKQLRELRNKLVHAAPYIEIDRKLLLEQISHLFREMGWRNAIVAFQNYEAKSHVSILFDPYVEINKSHEILDAARQEFGHLFVDEELLGVIGIADGYCPHCFGEHDADFSEKFVKTCVIGQNLLECAICGCFSEMRRLEDLRTVFYSPEDEEVHLVIERDGSICSRLSDREHSFVLSQIRAFRTK